MEKSQLAQGLTYTGEVQSINENISSFNKQQGGTSYCHLVGLTLPQFDNEYVGAQICLDFDRVEMFAAGDTIKFIAHKFTKGQWTIKFVEKVFKPMRPPVASSDAPPLIEEEPKRNPVMIGTLADRSMSHACHLLQMQRIEKGMLIDYANVIYDWMKEKMA